MDRYHIVSQFKQRERVVIIDPAGDPEAVKPNRENPNGILIIQPGVAASAATLGRRSNPYYQP